MKCTCNTNDFTYITLSFFKSKCNQCGVLFTDDEDIFSIFHHHVRQKKRLEDSPMQNALHFLPKCKQKTHSVIKSSGFPYINWRA